MTPEQRGYIRALRFDYLGEVSTEVNFRLQSFFTFAHPDVKKRMNELANLEAATREVIAKELARQGAGRPFSLWLRCLTFVLLLPVKILMPSSVFVRVLRTSAVKALAMYEGQRAQFGHLGPKFFKKLIAHELVQRDWAEAWLARRRGTIASG